MNNEIISRKKTARFAGVLYLLWIITAIYSMFYVTSKIPTRGDAGTVAQNILDHEFLFRTSIVNSLVSGIIWVVMVLVFYKMFRSVNHNYARLLVALVIVQIPPGILTDVFSIASLMIVKGEVLKTFELIQRQELAILFLRINDYVVTTMILFWGLWLFPLGALVYRSGFFPRFLGWWLIMNGVAYVVLSFISLLFPSYRPVVFQISFPALLGELIFMLWLLIKGAKEETSANA